MHQIAISVAINHKIRIDVLTFAWAGELRQNHV